MKRQLFTIHDITTGERLARFKSKSTLSILSTLKRRFRRGSWNTTAFTIRDNKETTQLAVHDITSL